MRGQGEGRKSTERIRRREKVEVNNETGGGFRERKLKEGGGRDTAGSRGKGNRRRVKENDGMG